METQTTLAVLSKIDFAKVVGQQTAIAIAVSAGTTAGMLLVGAGVYKINDWASKRKAAKNNQ